MQIMKQKKGESAKDYSRRSLLAFFFEQYIKKGFSKIEAQKLCDRHAKKIDIQNNEY